MQVKVYGWAVVVLVEQPMSFRCWMQGWVAGCSMNNEGVGGHNQ